MDFQGWRFVAGACIAVASGLSAPAAGAANPVAPDAAASEGLRRQEERSRLQQRAAQPSADVLRPPGAETGRAGTIPAEQPCFTISQIRLVGPERERFEWLKLVTRAVLGHCLGAKGLAALASRLDQALLLRGFATSRVSLPVQNLADGTLEVQLHAGTIADIRVVDPSDPVKPVAERDAWRTAFPLAIGDILNIRDLEQGVEQMQRLPSQMVSTQLEPGSSPDTSILVIRHQPGGWRERLRGGVTLDNSGSDALGRTQLSASVALDNPLGLNDLVSVSGSTNAERPSGDHHTQSVGMSYSIPWGYSTVSLGASYSRFAQHVQGTTVRFLSHGQSHSVEARLHRTIWRDSSAKLGIHGAVSMRRARSYLDDVELVIQRRRTTHAEIGVGYKQLLQDASLEVDVALRRGVGWGAEEDIPTASIGGPTLRPTLLTFGAQFVKAFELPGVGLPRLQYSASARGQFTRDATLSLDQIAIGGRHTVRGFDGDAVLIAENGWVLRNELATPIGLPAGLQDAALFAALDAGRVWGPNERQLVGRALAGAALGLRARAGRSHVQVTFATPISHPDGFRTRRWSAYLSLQHAF